MSSPSPSPSPSPSQDHSPPEEQEEGPLRKARTRRGAVSASVMTEEQATSYVKKVRE